MARAYEIPLSPDPQKFTVSLAGETYVIRLHWCAPARCWVFDLMDDSEAELVNAIPIVTGLDILKQYEYLGIKGSLIVQTDHAPDAVPDFDNLGTSGHLYFITE